ncbi:tRNA 4-thiouridine(8) synthase ThiI [Thermodesulfobacteriota bacterium]
MVCQQKKVRALGLCSGGLDSRLAAVVLRRQNIEVEWVTFETPFFSALKARQAAGLLDIPLTVKGITQPYMKMLKNPPCGYGKYMNPCLDCHTLMFTLAGKLMMERKFDFLFSGEVLGQRPMSQTRPSLRYVEKHSGFDGYILRPLSAKRLPETIPEKEGKVDREQLLDIAGRGRKIQIKLAKEYGITDYPAPAGGCLLTDKGYSTRLKDLFEHQDSCTERDLQLLKYGRHFRVSADTKIIIGRTRQDNDQIEKLYGADEDTLVTVKKYPGPTALLIRKFQEDAVSLAAALCAGYSKAPKFTPVDIQVRSGKKNKTMRVIPISPKEVKHLLL